MSTEPVEAVGKSENAKTNTTNDDNLAGHMLQHTYNCKMYIDTQFGIEIDKNTGLGRKLAKNDQTQINHDKCV